MMKKNIIQFFKILLILNLILICEAWFEAAKIGGLTTVELAEKYGYPIEKYVVETKDGIKLRLFRIPHGCKDKPKDGEPPRQPVLILHGIANSSDIWLMLGPEKGLGFILADRKFDVWIGDFRGSHYSNVLVEKTMSNKYWNSSFHEMGIYDYPAFINKVINTRKEERKSKSGNYGCQKLIIIAHSMGTTASYVLTSEKPDYVKDNIEIIVSFAPVAYMTNAGAIPFFTDMAGIAVKSMKMIGMKGLDGMYLRGAAKWIATDTIISSKILTHVLFLIAGYDYDQLDKSTIPIIFGHTPSGFTTKTLLHYFQLIEDSDEFRQYDYETEEKNVEMYNQKSPPDYKLENNAVPIILCYGSNDQISHVFNVQKLFNALKKGKGDVRLFKVNHKKFNHMDFMFANDVVELLYDPIINTIKKYINSKTTKDN